MSDVITVLVPDMSERTIWTCTCGGSEDEEPDADTLYECQDDGTFKRSDTENNNHQCPQCKKFGSKQAEGPICPDCSEAVMEEQSVDGCSIDGCDFHGNPGETDSEAYLKHFLEDHFEEIAVEYPVRKIA